MARKRNRRKALPQEPVRIKITSLSHDGRGVGHVNDKVVFVDGALPSEEVSFVYTEQRKDFDKGSCVEVHQASADRVEPKCPHYVVCGGCSLQHLEPRAQISHKQQVLLDSLQRIGKVTAEITYEPLQADQWAYRRKARLGAKFVNKKGKMLVGFRERNAPFLADMQQCEVLIEKVGKGLEDIGACIRSLSIYNKIPQVEVAAGDEHVALIFRHLEALTDADQAALIAFGQQYNYAIYLQPKGPDTVHLIYPATIDLSYQLKEYNITHHFLPTDFTQVNASINQAMIPRALALLELSAEDVVLDLFCGLGNFSLPLATKVKQVVGIEGEKNLIARARENALKNNITNVEYYVADLAEDMSKESWIKKYNYTKILLDPARPGAMEMMPLLAQLAPEKIVYVSCNPSTLARDAGILVNEHNYKLKGVGVMDMFPQTAHVESIALFNRD